MHALVLANGEHPPIELIEAHGTGTVRADPQVQDFPLRLSLFPLREWDGTDLLRCRGVPQPRNGCCIGGQWRWPGI